MEQTNTPFGNRCRILGQLWIDYKFEEEFKDFIKDIMLVRNPSASLENALEAWHIINKIYERS